MAGMKPAVLFSFVALFLAVPFSAVRGAETPHNFSKWEQEIAAFEQQDRTNPPPAGALLFLGSSTIRFWKTLAQDFPEHHVIRRGFGGCEIVDCAHFADRIVFPYRPKMIFFRCGGNDLWGGKSPEQVFADYREFVTAVHAKLPETEIVFLSLNPSIARWKQSDKEKALNTMVEAFTRRTPRLQYVETFEMVLGADGKPRPELYVADHLHFNDAGYRLLVERLRPFLPAK